MASSENGSRSAPYNVPDSHLVGREAVANEVVYAEEKEKVLDRVWRLACHESELPEKFDFRSFDRINPPLVVIRGDDARIRCFINVCSHRGARLINEPSGCSEHITCFFHHWSYDTRGRCTNILSLIHI